MPSTAVAIATASSPNLAPSPAAVVSALLSAGLLQQFIFCTIKCLLPPLEISPLLLPDFGIYAAA
eukprot:11173556-Ditylum_brightwellii.AAC.1